MNEKTAHSSRVAQAVSEAQTIVEAAKRRAQELESKAHAEMDAARERGYREGFARGQAEAAHNAVRLIEESTGLGERLTEQAARLAVAICPAVIGEHLKVTPEAVKSIARRALQESVIGEYVTLLVHPDDVGALEQIRVQLSKLAGGAPVAIESDTALSRGGCIVRTEFGEVDASVETLINSLASKIGIPINGR